MVGVDIAEQNVFFLFFSCSLFSSPLFIYTCGWFHLWHIAHQSANNSWPRMRGPVWSALCFSFFFLTAVVCVCVYGGKCRINRMTVFWVFLLILTMLAVSVGWRFPSPSHQLPFCERFFLGRRLLTPSSRREGLLTWGLHFPGISLQVLQPPSHAPKTWMLG